MKCRRLLSSLLAFAMVSGLLSGCGNNQAEQTDPAQNTSTIPATESTPTSTEEPAPDYNRFVDVTSEEARTAVLADGILDLAAQLPDAAWNSLPKWNGVTVPNLQEYGFEYDGQPQIFIREDMENISDLGFNFVRVPLDTRLFFDWDDPSKVHLEKLINLDELVSWGAEFGTHVCIDVHFSFGFTTDGDNSNDTLWDNPEEQEIFLAFWDMLAERYKEVPSSLLSFNLINEPNWGIEEEVYADLMRRAIERIRAHTPDRLIFVDMLNTAKEPVYSLAKDKVAQSFHFYEPDALTHTGVRDDFGSAYPVISGKGFISQDLGSAEFVIEGNFSAGTEVQIKIDEIHLGGTIHLTADGNEIFSHQYNYDSVGENGCIYIQEEGSGGEYRGYDNTLKAVLPEDAAVLRLYTTGDTYWFNLSRFFIRGLSRNYLFEQNLDPIPDGKNVNDIPNPHIIIHEDGTITDRGNILFRVVDGAYLHDRLAEYKAFSEKTGVAVMMQEFGVYYPANYSLTLEYLNDLLDAANANGLSWCSWDYFGPFSFYQVTEDRLRQGATYEEFSNGWVATEMLAVYQNHLTQNR